jgi:hypothetical protein
MDEQTNMKIVCAFLQLLLVNGKRKSKRSPAPFLKP